MKPHPSPSYLRGALRYDPETGDLTWRERDDRTRRWNSRWAGKRAGSVNGKGYVHVNLDGFFYPAHRIAIAMMRGRWPQGEVDHANGSRGDNRWANLREATTGQNRMNSRARGEWKKGVYRNRHGKFVAQIKLGGETVYLGGYDTESGAHDAYARKAREHFGEYACLNR